MYFVMPLNVLSVGRTCTVSGSICIWSFVGGAKVIPLFSIIYKLHRKKRMDCKLHENANTCYFKTI